MRVYKERLARYHTSRGDGEGHSGVIAGATGNFKERMDGYLS